MRSFPPPIGGGLIEAPQRPGTGQTATGGFRRRSAAASLKRHDRQVAVAVGRLFPPPIGGGLIEACAPA